MGEKKISLADTGLSIGMRIKIHRLLLNLRQFQVSELVGISQSVLSKIESGGYGTKISAELAAKLALVLEINLDELLEE